MVTPFSRSFGGRGEDLLQVGMGGGARLGEDRHGLVLRTDGADDHVLGEGLLDVVLHRPVFGEEIAAVLYVFRGSSDSPCR
jgi:hypothetical protein